MKKITLLVVIVSGIVASADICRSGAPRDIQFPGMKLKVVKVDSRWRVCEDVPIFSSIFAELPYPDSVLNYTEHRNLAIAVARTIAAELGSTNGIRVARREVPTPASTNIADLVRAMLDTKDVTEEVVPPFCPCTVHGFPRDSTANPPRINPYPPLHD